MTMTISKPSKQGQLKRPRQSRKSPVVKNVVAATMSAAVTALMKPKRALTAYNLFTVFARERIFNGTDHLDVPATVEDVQRISLQNKLRKRREHRRTGGDIAFHDLSNTIIHRWKTLAEEERTLFEQEAVTLKWERKAAVCRWNQAEVARKHKDARSKHELSCVSTEEESASSSDEFDHEILTSSSRSGGRQCPSLSCTPSSYPTRQSSIDLLSSFKATLVPQKQDPPSLRQELVGTGAFSSPIEHQVSCQAYSCDNMTAQSNAGSGNTGGCTLFEMALEDWEVCPHESAEFFFPHEPAQFCNPFFEEELAQVMIPCSKEEEEDLQEYWNQNLTDPIDPDMMDSLFTCG